MAKDDMTPEERLLKIIENPNTEKRKESLAAKVRSFDPGSVKEWFSGIRMDKDILKKINLKAINKIIAVICALVTLIWIFDFGSGGISLAKRFKRISSGESLVLPDEGKRPKIDVAIDEAMTQARKRNVFTFVPTKEEAASAVSVGPTLSNFKLVGILWSDNPQAMIENSQEQRTYFVSKGDKIGDLDVRSVLRDKVMLGKDDQEWELR
ncbi:MAG: hypothetical protein NT036_01070 [Candidatus Omnitrophica bacterium]|nr:hypothetical protein [Candidatus Omnitrophota bacterium]